MSLAEKHVYGLKKYQDEDMAISAIFESKQKEMRVFIIAPETEEGPEKQTRKKQGTGLRVRFRSGYLPIKNKAVLKLLLNHKQFNAGGIGFKIQSRDDSGFWRAMGLIEPKPVLMVNDSCVGVAKFKDIDFKKIKDIDPEKVETLIKVG